MALTNSYVSKSTKTLSTCKTFVERRRDVLQKNWTSHQLYTDKSIHSYSLQEMKLSTAFSIKKLGLGAGAALLSVPGKWGPMGVVAARARVCSVLDYFCFILQIFCRVMLNFRADMF